MQSYYNSLEKFNLYVHKPQNHTTQESQPNLIKKKKKALFDQSFPESQKKAMHIIDNYIYSLFHRAEYDISKYWCTRVQTKDQKEEGRLP